MSDFGHRLTLDRIRGGDRIDLVADSDERAAICERLGLASLDRLDAHAALDRDGDRIRASGRLKAALEQRCVATGEPLPVRVDEAFELLKSHLTAHHMVPETAQELKAPGIAKTQG